MDPLLTAGAFEITGLPLHPLLVHAVVVLAPLTALALLLGTLVPAARRRLGIVTPLAALVVAVLVPLTIAAGESLAAVVGARPAVQVHEGYARMLLPWAIGMLVVAAAQWAWFRWGATRAAERRGRGERAAPVVPIVLGALAAVAAIGTTVTVVLVGDSGSRAVWGGLLG